MMRSEIGCFLLLVPEFLVLHRLGEGSSPEPLQVIDNPSKAIDLGCSAANVRRRPLFAIFEKGEGGSEQEGIWL